MFRIFFICVLLATFSCRQPGKGHGIHFTLLPASATGVDFANSITENDSVNMFVNEYTYMGGGVGVGDFNHDGLPDLFFAGNQVSSRLYLNKGNMRFEDITAAAGVGTDRWCTGVSVVDINGDGWPDIYVCVSGKVPGARRKNLLFINQHNLTFKEEAAEYGLQDSGYSTQAVFFDYDKDGRVDMYLLRHTLDDPLPNNIRDRRVDSNAVAGDKLYHNEGVPPGGTHPVFRDVSHQAGIVEDGNGLGVVVGDFNGDGYPDIYVANDYIRNDLLWLNNGHGGFSNVIASAIGHQSYSSMGVDAADLNNDWLPDIITLDMQPETSERKKMMYSFLSEQRHQLEMEKGYEPQYIHNMLQLNVGNRVVGVGAAATGVGPAVPFFSEIGEMAGLAETDWSWSVLIADFDNDGWKDVHITNGLGRDPTNSDFLEYAHNTVLETGIPESEIGQRRKFMDRLTALGPLMLRNYLYRNKDGLSFQDVSADGGITATSVSNGAVYADLDNDGDLDIVTNNINGEAFVMRNDSHPNHWLTLRLAGDSGNPDGIGALVRVFGGGLTQTVAQYPVRGYLSSVDSRLHFGCGSSTLDSLVITWPDGKMQTLMQPPIDTILVLRHAAALVDDPAEAPETGAYFRDVTARLGVDFHHKETFFFDYQFQPLLLQKYSQEGPFISTGDIDGDGLEDFFVGGAFKQSGKVFRQNKSGGFSGSALVSGFKYEEDMQSVLFDANGDKFPDLLVVGGSSEFDDHSAFYRPRLFLNDGRGNFRLDSMAFPPAVRTLAKAVAVADIDGDGDADIFIGGRLSLGSYPQAPVSYLLRNDHGHFTDVTDTVCPALRNIGMVNAAVWADIDNDGKPDLIVTGDWMPIRIFHNDGRILTEITGKSGLGVSTGFWRTLLVADVDNDGYPDIVAGNLGLNNPFHIDATRPAELVAKDFDGNGTIDPIFCYYMKDVAGVYRLAPGVSRDGWARQMPSIKKRYELNTEYARAGMDEVLTRDMMAGALVLDCKETRSGYWKGDGKGGFVFRPFPAMAQIAPVNAVVCADVTGDGIPDLILAGNEYQSATISGRYDASHGLLLVGDGKGGFTPMRPTAAGLVLDGDVRDMKLVRAGGRRVLLVAVNDQSMRAYELKIP
jgi:enediyne biosynthesis protein E4